MVHLDGDFELHSVSFGAGYRAASVKPAAQFLQQGRRLLAQGGIALARFDAEEALEGGDRGATLVEPGVDLSGLEQQFGTVRGDRQHAIK
jgi:hypothetical protein